jgi:hypothetical protein
MPVNHVLLETIQLGQSAASVTFDNIPQTGYTDLIIKGSTRTDRSDAVNDFFKILPNGSSSSWTARFLQGTGSSSDSYTQSVASNIAGETNAGLSTANIYGSFELYIPNYTSTNKNKSLFSASSMENNATVGISNILTGLWSNTNAITSLTFTPGVGSNWLAHSTFSLYGVAATGTSPSVGPKAQGGNIVANDGTYWYHAFLTSGFFTPTVALTCDYLVVAGGGGGGNFNGGGGGAGGLRSTVTATGGGGSLESPISVTAQAYPITIGAGGAGMTSGNNSIFSTITSTAGGRGGDYASTNTSATGGSGGGNGAIETFNGTPFATAGSGTTGQGYAGGLGGFNAGGGGNKRVTGGGGGAGAVGGNGNTSSGVSGNGGSGVAISSFATATSTGVSNYYAGGGGGGADTNTTAAGTGGAGGGGNGSRPGTGGSGTANTGGGGGGGGNSSGTPDYQAPGGIGGSGIVIIRYAMA